MENKIKVVISETKLVTDDTTGHDYTVYLVKTQVGDKVWTLSKRYNSFYELHVGVKILGKIHILKPPLRCKTLFLELCCQISPQE